MKIKSSYPWVVLLAVSTLPLLVLSEEESAHQVGCLPRTTVQDPSSVCTGCHNDATERWQANQNSPCTPYCMTCHKKAQLGRHHNVGVQLPITPKKLLKLTADGKNACFTCHDLSRPRYDGERWKAASLYDRMFRPEKRYKTYFLVERNDRGQLCLSCH